MKKKLAEANARQLQAFDDDDDEAEEAAMEEMERLTAELEALSKGKSIPKQKLEDAKKKDSELNQ